MGFLRTRDGVWRRGKGFLVVRKRVFEGMGFLRVRKRLFGGVKEAF